MPCLIYSYYYGDDWEILITLLGLREGEEGEKVPTGLESSNINNAHQLDTDSFLRYNPNSIYQ